MEKLIITVAPTGAWPTKKDTPYVPLTPKEIAEEVYQCWKAGASIAHIHVRNDDAAASMNFDKFKETVTLIRGKKECDIILNLTTSGGIGLKDDERMRPFMELKPEMASFDAGTMNWQNRTVFENRPDFLEKLAKAQREHHVKPELELFDAGMLYNTLYLVEQGFLEPPLHYQLCLGVPGGMAATVENFMYLKSILPQGSTWSAFAVGRMHLTILFMAVITGGHVRVGMEDNVFMAKGVLAKSNVEFVERVKRIAKEFQREIATPAEARKLLGLNGREPQK
jgi:3-keto-5-aminohexanoate cleavage enzyme